jgi:hypothetical protein
MTGDRFSTHRSRGATRVRDTAPAMPPATSLSYNCCGGARFSLRTAHASLQSMLGPMSACPVASSLGLTPLPGATQPWAAHAKASSQFNVQRTCSPVLNA